MVYFSFQQRIFLDSIGTTFEYRYTKAEDGKFILQFRTLKGSEWKTKPVSFCITHHGLKKDEANNFYSLEETSQDAADEAFAIVNVQDFLNQLMLVNGPVGRTPIHKIYKDESELKIMKPYRFHVQNFFNTLKEPGLICLRAGNGWLFEAGTDSYYYGANLGFNSWKYVALKKRKAEMQVYPEMPAEDIEIKLEA
jgi:hypothetical protein